MWELSYIEKTSGLLLKSLNFKEGEPIIKDINLNVLNSLNKEYGINQPINKEDFYNNYNNNSLEKGDYNSSNNYFDSLLNSQEYKEKEKEREDFYKKYGIIGENSSFILDEKENIKWKEGYLKDLNQL